MANITLHNRYCNIGLNVNNVTRIFPHTRGGGRGTARKFACKISSVPFQTVFTDRPTVFVAQSVWRLATGCTFEGSEFESRYSQDFCLLHVVQTGSGVHPASYPVGTVGCFPGGKAVGA
jgi:hypothetical protein